MITIETATDIAMAHREIEAAEKLLADIEGAVDRFATKDIRDAFGRRQDGLQLGVPSGENGHRLFTVSWKLARPVIEAHIAECRSRLDALAMKAGHELSEAATRKAQS